MKHPALRRAFAGIHPAILATALAARILWMLTHSIISNDGAEYARIAANLLAGKGYVGMTAGPHLVFPPFFPALTAGAALLTGDPETGGRLASLIMGLLFLLPLAASARLLFGRKAVTAALLLAAVHPALIISSGKVLSEAAYLTMFMTALYFGLLGLRNLRPAALFASGLFFGLAYLTRPEAWLQFGLFFAFGLGTWIVKKTGFRRAAGSLACLFFGFALCAAPYIAYLTSQTGRFHMEGKSPIHYVVGRRLMEGKTPAEAKLGIDAELREAGPLLDHSLYLKDNPYPRRPRDLAGYGAWAVRRNLGPFLRIAALNPTLVIPVLLILSLFGLFAAPRPPNTRGADLLLGLSLGVSTLGILLPYQVGSRFLIPLLPVLLIWSAGGLHDLAVRVARRTRRPRSGEEKDDPWRTRPGRLLTIGLLAAALLAAAFHLASNKPEPASRAYKAAGLWLRHRLPPGAGVMSLRTAVPFYAGAVWQPMPAADAERTLAYILKKKPEVVILEKTEASGFPALSKWGREGFPARVYRKAHEEAAGGKVFVEIFRLRARDDL